jgi:23S rRNA (uracil1939-C5)-methyltransferase
MTAVLYSEALRMAMLSKNDTVIDLYCGVGTIGMAASKLAGKVIGVEIVPSAVENARENAHINNIDNIEFICADASQAAVQFVREGIKADVVFVDPPRKGCDTVTLEAIEAIGPRRLVYVSCNPATLARDLKYLYGHGYQVEEIQPVDQFAQTYHVETVCSLVKRENI